MVSILTVSEVAANADTRAGAMRDTTLALVPNSLGKITQTNTPTNLGDTRSLI